MDIFSKEMLFAGGGAWVRPNLTANGTLGGNAFAVMSSINRGDEYKAVDGSSSTYAILTRYSYFTFYNPTPLKVTQLVALYTSSSYYGRVTDVLVSNNNSTWTAISVSRSGSTTETITLSNSTYYKYYQISFNRGSSSVSQIRLAELQITAEEQ